MTDIVPSAEGVAALHATIAELRQERDAAVAVQAALTDVMNVINQHAGDLAPVFDTLLDAVLRLSDSSFGSLQSYDGGAIRFIAIRGADLGDSGRAFAVDPGTLMHRIVLGEEIVSLADITDDDAYRAGAPNRVRMADVYGARSQLIAGLRKDGRLIGFINIYRKQISPFTASQIAMVKAFAAQAVIAMENARLLDELRVRTEALAQRNSEYGEKIEHQSATIDVLKAMSASPGDAQPAFDLIVRHALKACNGMSAALWEYDGERVHYRAGCGGDTDAIRTFNSLFPQPPTRDFLTGRALLDRQTIHVRDIDTEPGLLPEVRAMGGRTTLVLPLLRDSEPMGTISLNAAEPGGFSDSQIALLETFAEQAVIAITSAKTYRALQERTEALAARNSEFGERIEQQSATIDVLKVMSASPGDARPVFDLIAQRARSFCGAATAAVSLLEGDNIHLQAHAGFDDETAREYVSLFPMPLSPATMFGRAMLAREVVQLRDTLSDPTFSLANLSQAMALRSIMAVPMLRGGLAIGAIVITRAPTGGFSPTQEELLRTFAEQAVIAIGSAETYRALQERTEALALRNSEYGERIEQQAATIDVLKAMSGSPGDAQPVFELIARRALDFCGAAGARLLEYDGQLQHLRALVRADGVETEGDLAVRRSYPSPPEIDSIAGRCILRGEIVHARDESEVTAVARGRFLGSVVAVPLLREGRVAGAIALSRTQTGGFSETQVELLRTFAEQAVIAIASAETYRALQERTEALALRNSEYGERIEQQSATIDVLKVMSRTPDNTRPVFEQIVRRAKELCNAWTAGLFEYDGDRLHFSAYYGGEGETAEFAAYLALFPMVPNHNVIAGRAILEKKLIHVRNLDDDDKLHPIVQSLTHKSVLALPLMRDDTAIGVIIVNTKESGGFTDSQIALLQTFAEQAVIAIGSVATFRELQERTQALTRSVAELQALEEVLRAVNSSLDLDTVLSTIISRAVQLSDADQGTIYEFDSAEQVFVPKAAFGMTAERVEELRDRRIRMGETPLGISAADRAPLHIPDLSERLDIDGARELMASGMRALLAVPLLRDDTVIGGLVIRRHTAGGFAPSIPTLMRTFAGQAVLAIENARLFQEAGRARTAAEVALVDLRRAQDRLVQSEKMASLGQLTAGIAHEIKNPLNFVNNFADLSRDLLDELSAAVVADLRDEIEELTATLKGNLEKIAQHGRRADSIVKNMLLHSRSGPSEHRTIDLNATVEEALNLAYHGARAETPGFNITMQKDFDPAAGTVELYPQEFIRVMVNLINNGFYAARKRSLEPGFEPTLRLATHDLGDRVEIRVRDNGTGISAAVRDRIFEPFFTTKPAGEGTGLGLSLSYDIVVKQHGGQLAVDSEPGEFTEFTITLPREMAAEAVAP